MLRAATESIPESTVSETASLTLKVPHGVALVVHEVPPLVVTSAVCVGTCASSAASAVRLFSILGRDVSAETGLLLRVQDNE